MTATHMRRTVARAKSVPVAVEARRLTKAYGNRRVVDDLSFVVRAGRVTGFLGPNGAGKTTTLRMLLGLAMPTAGDALVCGRRFADLESPARTVGALVDVADLYSGRRVHDELAVHAAAGIADERVDVVLAEVGLEAARTKRVSTLSLGMKQRLGLAAALLGDPAVLILDEPANGLDPAGMHWLRDLLRRYAARGAAVLLSSHVLADIALVAHDAIVINHGRIVVEDTIERLVGNGAHRVYVESAARGLRGALVARGGALAPHDAGWLVSGMSAADIGCVAAAEGAVLRQLRTEPGSLEDVFLDVTGDGGGIR